ncbi:MAG: hypothetical protein WCI92_20355, partial [Bacteroidota bacterium]
KAYTKHIQSIYKAYTKHIKTLSEGKRIQHKLWKDFAWSLHETCKEMSQPQAYYSFADEGTMCF